jgi:hypothetical protein
MCTLYLLSHPTASIVYSAKSLCICIWPNMSVSASIPIHKHGQKWPLQRLKVKLNAIVNFNKSESHFLELHIMFHC